ncbi:lysophospholipid acyltransferase family protein [Chitinispirillales bacterium ANBcel5]|uniref:lysophospholipid acyltransferase family protein n=1 Tax=Cellulosispirillum alkaliphilum TaxID=3039283 RepID=UPI002A583C67|nr:lysophospholipid acyltransferase family protein [Chitinispirillales bacterium ANBcel5]
MDFKDCSIEGKSNLLHTFLFVTWCFVFTILYGLACIFLSVFNKNIARKLARLWNVQLLKIAGVKVHIIGKEKLSSDEHYVFVSNHQSALDIPVLYQLYHNVSFIAKKELFMIPIFGWGLAAVGHIWIDRTNARKAHNSIKRAINRLHKEKVSLILFPEGTRSKYGSVGEFKKASFSLALQANVKLVPVAIIDAAKRLPKSSCRIVPGKVTLAIGDPISPSELKNKNKAEIALEVRERITSMISNKQTTRQTESS